MILPSLSTQPPYPLSPNAELDGGCTHKKSQSETFSFRQRLGSAHLHPMIALLHFLAAPSSPPHIFEPSVGVQMPSFGLLRSLEAMVKGSITHAWPSPQTCASSRARSHVGRCRGFLSREPGGTALTILVEWDLRTRPLPTATSQPSFWGREWTRESMERDMIAKICMVIELTKYHHCERSEKCLLLVEVRFVN
jgi:hypothetical protein